MKRRSFLTMAGLSAIGIAAWQIETRFKMLNGLQSGSATEKMPVLFFGHGSPMNAIETNSYTQTLNKIGEGLPTPKAILVISAHWMTKGTWVTAMKRPKTIHDFHGFPEELYQVQYPAPGSPEFAKLIQQSLEGRSLGLDSQEWGLDHGTWSVLRHLFPQADVPVLQLSMDMTKPADYHFKLGQELAGLRQKGVLLIGSGNIVHNLRQIKWQAEAPAFDWAIEFDQWIKQRLLQRDYKAIINDYEQSAAGRLSVPTPDHYFPMHYILGASQSSDELTFEYEEMQNGSISMRSFKFA